MTIETALFDAALTAPVPWWRKRMCGLDIETSRPVWDTAGPDVNEERIVSAAVALVGGGGETWSHTWLVNPGFAIPPESTAIHGIHDEDVADAPLIGEVMPELLDVVNGAIDEGMAIVAYNAPYDFTVTDREAKRCRALDGPDHMLLDWANALVVDPMLCDRMLDTFRRGSRKLTDTTAIWNARAQRRVAEAGREWLAGDLLARERGGPHEAAQDAIATARLAWLLAAYGEAYSYDQPVRKNDRASREMLALQAQWDATVDDLSALHAWQRQWRADDQRRLKAHWESQGNPKAAGVRPEWPVYPEGVRVG